MYCIVLGQSETSFYKGTLAHIYKQIEFKFKRSNDKGEEDTECRGLDDFLS